MFDESNTTSDKEFSWSVNVPKYNKHQDRASNVSLNSDSIHAQLFG